jgi:hypothetical protein
VCLRGHLVTQYQDFTIMVDHSFLAPDVNVRGDARSLPGSIVDSDGNKMSPTVNWAMLIVADHSAECKC